MNVSPADHRRPGAIPADRTMAVRRPRASTQLIRAF
jgi:hypothetical protein